MPINHYADDINIEVINKELLVKAGLYVCSYYPNGRRSRDFMNLMEYAINNNIAMETKMFKAAFGILGGNYGEISFIKFFDFMKEKNIKNLGINFLAKSFTKSECSHAVVEKIVDYANTNNIDLKDLFKKATKKSLACYGGYNIESIFREITANNVSIDIRTDLSEFFNEAIENNLTAEHNYLLDVIKIIDKFDIQNTSINNLDTKTRIKEHFIAKIENLITRNISSDPSSDLTSILNICARHDIEIPTEMRNRIRGLISAREQAFANFWSEMSTSKALELEKAVNALRKTYEDKQIAQNVNVSYKDLINAWNMDLRYNEIPLKIDNKYSILFPNGVAYDAFTAISRQISSGNEWEALLSKVDKNIIMTSGFLPGSNYINNGYLEGKRRSEDLNDKSIGILPEEFRSNKYLVARFTLPLPKKLNEQILGEFEMFIIKEFCIKNVTKLDTERYNPKTFGRNKIAKIIKKDQKN